jgi:hypothetical protein
LDYLNCFFLLFLFRQRAEDLSKNLQQQLELCRQGGGEKGVERHVKLNRKVSILVYSNSWSFVDKGEERRGLRDMLSGIEWLVY